MNSKPDTKKMYLEIEILRSMLDVHVVQSTLIPEKDWYNPIRKKWVTEKYLSRTKHKLLMPVIFLMDGKIHLNPKNMIFINQSDGKEK